MQRENKRTMMFKLIEQWRQSGMSQIKFAKSKNIKLRKFCYWIKRYKQSQQDQQEPVQQAQSNDTGFIELSGISSQNILIRYPNGVEISIPVQLPADYVRTLVKY